MKIVKPSATTLPAPTTPGEMLKHIERCGRVCYKSEDKITEGSAEKFIAGIIKRGHEAVLEHGDFCFSTDRDVWVWIKDRAELMETFGKKCYLRFTKPGFDAHCHWLVSGNVRAWREFLKFTRPRCRLGKLPEFLKEFINDNYVLFPELQDAEFVHRSEEFRGMFDWVTDYSVLTKTERLVHQTVTALFVCDRGVTHEIVRHRPASYCQESTRYCNYGKGEFGSEITVVEPPFFKGGEYQWWKGAMKEAEMRYLGLLDKGASPQEARSVLPNSLKTELMMTANMQEWLHYFDLRTGVAAHPQIREVSLLLKGRMYEIVADLMEVAEHG